MYYAFGTADDVLTFSIRPHTLPGGVTSVIRTDIKMYCIESRAVEVERKIVSILESKETGFSRVDFQIQHPCEFVLTVRFILQVHDVMTVGLGLGLYGRSLNCSVSKFSRAVSELLWRYICSILPARRDSDTFFSQERAIRICPRKDIFVRREEKAVGISFHCQEGATIIFPKKKDPMIGHTAGTETKENIPRKAQVHGNLE